MEIRRRRPSTADRRAWLCGGASGQDGGPMQESGLVELARHVAPDEEILAAGVFAPAGSAEGAGS